MSAERLDQLARSEREGRLQERIRFFGRPALLIVDEIGYLPVVPGGGNLFCRARRDNPHLQSRLCRMGRGFWGSPWSRPRYWTGSFTTLSSST
jgi:hypothetical protein